MPFVRTLLILALVVPQIVAPRLTAQTAPTVTESKEDPQRQHAIELYRAGKFVEAMPLFEDANANHPNDVQVKEGLAFSTYAYAATLTDPELRRKARLRARTLALEAQKLGDNTQMLQMLLGLPEDGSEPPPTGPKEVNDAMQNAESAFVHGDFDKARDGYLRVLVLDPKNYLAALYMGDVYFKQHINGSAGEWFARAVEIDPDRETAYRYWGDSLSDLGKVGDAREKYIRAIIAEPYNQRSWFGLNNWASRNKLALNWVKLQDKSSVTQKDDKNINITLDSSFSKDDPAGAAWLIYGMNRALWHGEKFKKEFPAENQYRHTLREEAESLHMMVSTMTAQKDFEKKKKLLDPSLVGLIEIDQKGFLEPFALLNRADREIVQDYESYRTNNRDKLYRYFDEFVVPKAPMK